tara:strand:+ start:86 stop:289 length:204 start_codon:yes stop_codon:yes gene_type:complete
MGSDKYFKINEVNLPPKVINEMAKAKMEQNYAYAEITRIQNEQILQQKKQKAIMPPPRADVRESYER